MHNVILKIIMLITYALLTVCALTTPVINKFNVSAYGKASQKVPVHMMV